MSRMQREKGKAGEREVCGILSDALGARFTRNLGQERDEGNDIDVPRVGGGSFVLEVKRHEQLRPYAFMDQVEREVQLRARLRVAGRPDVPIVVMRQNGRQWLGLMWFADLVPLIGNELAPPARPVISAAAVEETNLENLRVFPLGGGS